MRVMTLMIVLALFAMPALPVVADEYGTTSPPAAPSMEAAPTPPTAMETPEATMESAAPPAAVVTTPPMAVAMSPEVDAYNRQFARQYFGLSDADVTALRTQGMTWGEIYLSANVAQRCHQPVSRIASLRSQGLSWTEIGSRYNVASSDLTTVYVIPGRVAGIAAEVPIGMYPSAIYNKNGMVVLTAVDVRFFERMGFSWREIAVATNIAKLTGESVDDILRIEASGKTWSQICLERGLNPDSIMNVNDFPFNKEFVEYRHHRY